MSRGKRYDSEPKLNYKKVFGVIIGISVVVMMVITIVNLARNNDRRRWSGGS